MGKQGKSKKLRGAARTDPMAAGTAAAATGQGGGPVMEAEAEEVTGQIVSELGAMSAERRAKAAHAVAGVAATGMIGLRALLKMGVVSRLTRLLCDTSVDVRAASAAALRNAGTRGGDAGYAAIVEADVMTPLLAALQQAGAELAAGGERRDAAVELACLLLDLLWELCESSSAAVERFNAGGPDFVASLVHLSCPPLAPAAPSVAGSAAQCLNVLSEDNPQVEAFFRGQPAALQALHAVVGDASTLPLVAILTAGTLLNLSPEARPADLPASLQRIFAAAMQDDHMGPLPDALAHLHALSTGTLEPVGKAAEAIAAGATAAAGGEGAEEKVQKNLKAIKCDKFSEQFLHTEVDAAEAVREELDAWSKRVTVTQIALQLLSNMLLSAAEEEEGGGSDGWESAGEDDEGGGMEEETATGRGFAAEGDGHMAAWAVQSGLLEGACRLCQFPPQTSLEAFCTVGAPGLPAWESVTQLLVNAIDCVSNWTSCAPDAAASHLQAVRSHVIAPLCEAHPRLLAALPSEYLPLLLPVDEALSSLVASYVRRSLPFGLEAASLPPPAMDALSRWAQGAEAAPRSNAVWALGALGKVDRDTGRNAAIGGLLMHVVASSGDVVAASEALGAIYECYAEDDVNESVLAPMQMLQKLAAGKGAFQAASKEWLGKAKKEAKRDVEVRRQVAMVAEARANLPRFIEYKVQMGMAL